MWSDYTFESVLMRETVRFVYIDWDSDCYNWKYFQTWPRMKCLELLQPLMQFCVKQTIPLDSLKDDIILHQQVKYILLYIYIYSVFTFCIGAVCKYWVLFFPFSFHTCYIYLYFKCLTRGESHFFSTWYQPEKNVNLQEKLVFMLLLPAYHSLSSSEPKTKDLCTLMERYCLSDGSLCVDRETELLFL